MGVNVKGIVSGGEWYTPIDLPASIANNREIVDNSKIFSQQNPAFWYIDAAMTYKTNHSKWTGTWSLQLKNLLNQEPIVGYVFNPYTKAIETQKGFGLLPFFSYKVEF